MADTRPKYTTVARAKNYWMSTQALSIMLNALGEPNRIQASAASGARFFCHFEDIGDADAESVFGFDVGHNFPSWPLSISPTYFSTNKAVYPHISIPRDDNGNAQAMVVFPTEVLDLWGYATYTEPMKNEDGNYIDEYGNVVTRAADAATAYIRKKKSGSTTIDDDPIGSDDYYYIFLQGMITSSGDAGTTARRWNPMYATGLLNTAESWGEVITIEQLAKEMKKKVDVDWFQRIFTIHGTERKRVINSYDADGNPVYAKDANGNYIYSGTSTKRDVKPNDMDHEITDTQSMFGTWTEQFLSALGKGSGSGGSGTALEQPLLTINTSNMGLPSAQQDGYTFVWDHTLNGGQGGFKWGKAGGSEDDILKSPLKEINKADLGTSTANGSLLLYRNGAWGYSTIPYLLKISDSNHSLTVDTTLTWATGTFSLDIKPLLDNYLSQDDADTRYVRKAWFDKVFKTYVGSTLKAVNDAGVIAGTTTLDNLKILVGTWTEQYISALGQGSGGGGGGSTALNEPLMSINDINANPTSGQVGYTLVWNGSSWGYGTSGIDQTALSNYLTTNNYIKADSATKWWGQTMSNGIVTGNMTNVGDISFDTNGTRNIGSTSNSALAIFARSGYFLSTAPAVHVGNDNTHFIALHWANPVDNVITRGLYDSAGGWVWGYNGTNTYLMGGNVGVGLQAPTVKLHVNGGVLATKVYLYKPNAANDTGAVYLEYDSTKLGIHLVGAGIYTDTYVSALGAGSGGGAATGMDWEALETYDNQHQIDIRYLDLSSYALKSEIPSEFNLQKASSTVLGGVKVGDTLVIDNSGVLNQKSGVATVGTYFKATVDTYGRVTGGSDSLVAADIPNLAASKITSGTFGDARISDVAWSKITGKPSTLSGYGITASDSLFASITVGKASQLETTRKLWGNDFNGTQDVGTSSSPASLSNVGDISFQASGKNIGGVAYFDTTNTRLGIGAAPGNYTLDVTGNVHASLTSWFPAIELFGELANDGVRYPYIDFHYNQSSGDYTTRIIESANGVLSIMKSSGATGLVVGNNAANGGVNGDYIKIGGATLTWDGSALKIDTGFYSESFVSALGTGSGGSSGGGGIDMNDVWSALGAGTDEKIANSHLNFNINNYVTTDELNTAIGNCVAPSDIGTLTINNQTWNPYADGDKTITISGSGVESDILVSLNNSATQLSAGALSYNGSSWSFGSYIPINGSSNITGDLYPAPNLTTLWLGNNGQRWEYVYANNMIGSENITMGGNISASGTVSGRFVVAGESLKATTIYSSSNGDMTIQGSLSSGDLSLCAGGGNVGVGSSANSNYKLYINGDTKIAATLDINGFSISKVQGSYYIGANTDTWVVGDWYGSFIPDSSDQRDKDFVQNTELSLEDVARAPIIEFTWKDKRDNRIHLGSYAQYWEYRLTGAVITKPNGRLAMDYGATALAAAVMTARTVLTHEEQIAALTGRLDAVEQENKAIKAENAWLRQEIEQLKAA